MRPDATEVAVAARTFLTNKQYHRITEETRFNSIIKKFMCTVKGSERIRQRQISSSALSELVYLTGSLETDASEAAANQSPDSLSSVT